MLLPDSLQFVRATFVDTVEDGDEQIGEHVEYLVVMLVDGHLQIEPGEFAQVSTGVGILGPKDRSAFVHALESRARGGHLLVKLRTHGEARGLAEVIEGEDVGSALGRSADDLGGVDLDETLGVETFPEQCAHHRFDPEDGLIGRSAQIDPSVIQPHLLTDASHPVVPLLLRLIVLGRVRAERGLLDCVGTARVLHLKRESAAPLGDATEFGDLNLDHLLSRGIDGLIGNGEDTLHVHDALGRQTGDVLDHGL
mmetsp:Transcript_43550/g.132546  ORF Transcript_43550/g.132546 Transcript_43550/m.132546 type:complete len:253 (-) Transcript_43550:1064-1822(-)